MSTGDRLDVGLVERVLAAVRRIPPGRVLSHGHVVRLAPAPRWSAAQREPDDDAQPSLFD